MHIMEGFLPLKHAVAWTAASAREAESKTSDHSGRRKANWLTGTSCGPLPSIVKRDRRVRSLALGLDNQPGFRGFPRAPVTSLCHSSS